MERGECSTRSQTTEKEASLASRRPAEQNVTRAQERSPTAEKPTSKEGQPFPTLPTPTYAEIIQAATPMSITETAATLPTQVLLDMTTQEPCQDLETGVLEAGHIISPRLAHATDASTPRTIRTQPHQEA